MFTSVLKIDIGVITSFAGSLGNIPPGWFLCDGSNGTPDLRTKFVPATGPLFPIDDVDGHTSHTHNLTDGGHAHSVDAGSAIASGFGRLNTMHDSANLSVTNPANQFPTFYALAYIQFLGT